jgi:hypothetical protein
VLHDLASDDSDSPAIGLVPAETSWDEVEDHIKIVHGPLLIGPDDHGNYVGAYWANARMMVTGDLGSEQEQAIDEFREHLYEQGEAY